MKRLLLLFMVFVTSFIWCEAQNIAVQDTVAAFKLYPTKNMWTFIKLDTRNGQMWQVQYSINNDSERGETILSLKRHAFGHDEINGRFALYPTENMYNFILLDQIDGRTWQVQWSFEYNNRGIIPISGD